MGHESSLLQSSQRVTYLKNDQGTVSISGSTSSSRCLLDEAIPQCSRSGLSQRLLFVEVQSLSWKHWDRESFRVYRLSSPMQKPGKTSRLATGCVCKSCSLDNKCSQKDLFLKEAWHLHAKGKCKQWDKISYSRHDQHRSLRSHPQHKALKALGQNIVQPRMTFPLWQRDKGTYQKEVNDW